MYVPYRRRILPPRISSTLAKSFIPGAFTLHPEFPSGSPAVHCGANKNARKCAHLMAHRKIGQERIQSANRICKKRKDPMKKRGLVMTGLLVLSILAATRVARAQQLMVVGVAFAFVAQQATLPFGYFYFAAS